MANIQKEKVDINQLFKLAKENRGYLNVSAPMVRYSKLEFRKLIRKYSVDLCFTPMIIAKSFHESSEARKVEFTTELDDKPLIAQLAASNSSDLCKASNLLYPYVDGIDINCGCPQKWAISSGYGCALLKEPQILFDMIKTLKRIQSTSEFSYSIKMRLLQQQNLKYTIDLCRQFESCGITFLTIHGRTSWQKSSDPVNIDAIADIKKSLNIPIIGNGNIRKLNDVKNMYEKTKCDGIMSARGLLSNPTLFMGNEITTIDCIQNWLNIAYTANNNITFQCLHHHLTFMMEKYLKRKQRVQFNQLNKKQQIYDFLYDKFNLIPKIEENYNLLDIDFYYHNPIENCNDNLLYKENFNLDNIQKWNENSNNGGKFFNNFQNIILKNNSSELDDCDSLNFMGTNIFDN